MRKSTINLNEASVSNYFSVAAIIVSILFLGFQNAKANSNRIDGSTSYSSVGLVAFNGGPTCSGTIIKHGVMLTAKHCFSNRPYTDESVQSWSLHFPVNSTMGISSVLVPGEKIKKIVMDTGDNDIAYILYDPSVTLSKLAIDVMSISAKDDMNESREAKIVGFPSQETMFSHTPKVIAQNCNFTGIFGRTPGYQGLLVGTNCGAYWGVSGGPVFIEDLATNKFTRLVGVVTHTFAMEKDGSLDQTKLQRDRFGKYINDTNVSPLTDAVNLKILLSMDLSKIPNSEKRSKQPLKQKCGYSNFSEVMTEAYQAVQTIRNSKEFKPTFWIDNNPALEKMALDNMALKNQEIESNRAGFERSNPWTRGIYQDFNTLRSTENLKTFREKGIGQLTFTNDVHECDALECTNYFDFTILMNVNPA